MPLTTTANYNTYNVATGSKKPVVIITFSGIAGTKFCSDIFSDWTTTYKKYIVACEYTFTSIDPFHDGIEFGGATFTLLDYNDEITAFLNANNIEDVEVTIKHGFRELAEADFTTLPVVKIYDYKLSDDLISYEFFCYDVFKDMDESICKEFPITYLTASEDDSDLTWNVGSTTAFIDPTALPTGTPAIHLVCDKEVVSYSAKGVGTFTVVRGQFNTNAAGHNLGTPVIQGFILDGNFAEILLRILTTTDAGTNGDYDLGWDNFGLGISESKINITQIEREGWRFHAHNRLGTYGAMRFLIAEEVNALQFIQEKLLKPFNAILYLDLNGLICLKVQDYIKEVNDFVNNDLNESDIEATPKIETLNNKLINRIRFDYVKHPLLVNKHDIAIWKYNDSVTAYSSKNIIDISEKWDSSGGIEYLSSSAYIQNCAYRYFLYFGNLMQKMTVRLQPHNWKYLPNDTVRITHSKIPDISTGTRGITTEKGIILSNHTNLLQEMSCDVSILLFNIFDKVTSTYTLGKITSFDRATVQYSATKLSALEAEDGYWDDGAPGDGGEFYVKLTITPPGGTDTEQYIDIQIGMEDSLSNWTYILYRLRYNSSWSAAFDVWLFATYIIDPYNPGSYIRLKVDWYNASATAISGDRPSSIVISEIWKIKLNKDISAE